MIPLLLVLFFGWRTFNGWMKGVCMHCRGWPFVCTCQVFFYVGKLCSDGSREHRSGCRYRPDDRPAQVWRTASHQWKDHCCQFCGRLWKLCYLCQQSDRNWESGEVQQVWRNYEEWVVWTWWGSQSWLQAGEWKKGTPLTIVHGILEFLLQKAEGESTIEKV